MCVLKTSSKHIMPSKEGMSNTPLILEYEVFLSFRRSDTRDDFTDHLYRSLINVGIRAYRDDEELRIGEDIGPGLLKGIKESKIAIPIFSKDYASSKWCLKELAEIVKWKQSTDLKVMPIFYYVAPYEVRNQIGDYKKAFESHEKYHDEKTIQEWREALRQVGQLKGWEVQTNKNRQEGKLVDEVIKLVLRELKKAYTTVTDNLIGVEHHVEAILDMITVEANDVRIVGIHGMGGIGKTTLAKVIYNHLLSHYEACSFLADIRETSRSKGIEFLQKKLISDILKREWTNISNIDEGIVDISERFVNKKVLILLDDVDQISQQKGLIGKGKSFGLGSRIILTTRNKSILDSIEVEWPYELSCMEPQHALQLFNRHAFRSDLTPEEYTILARKAIEITGGLPLALEVIGSLLCGKGKKAWNSIIKKLEKVPNEDVFGKLKISFDSLDEEQKQIFLDIACFFIEYNARVLIHFWNDSELFPEEALEVFQQMSLVKMQKDNSIWMQDQLRDMGRYIVRQEHTDAEKRSRLWNPETATDYFMRNMGNENVRGIFLNFGWQRGCRFPSEKFTLLPNLRLLHVKGEVLTDEEVFFPDDNLAVVLGSWFSRIISWNISSVFSYKRSPIFSKLRWLSWSGFSRTYETQNFSLENLIILDLSWSNILTGWSGWRCIKMAKKLRVLNLTGCTLLVKTPDFSSHPLLEELILENCSSLAQIDASITMLEHLVIINVAGCSRLRKLPEKLSCMESLEEIKIDVSSIVEVPDWPEMKKLMVFSATHCRSLNKVSSLNFATSLLKLSLAYCIEIQTLPRSIGNLVSLKELNVSHSHIIELPDTISNLKNLNSLDVSSTPMRKLPATIGMMENLLRLDASLCDQMIDLPKLPPSLISLKASSVKLERMPDLSNLIHLRNLELLWMKGPFDPFETSSSAPWWIVKLTNLETLGLGFSQVITLNPDLIGLSQLKELKIIGCDELRSIPMLPSSLISLSISNCMSLETLSNLPMSLMKLEIISCSSLRALLDLPSDLTTLIIRRCGQLQMLPDLSNLNKLKKFEVGSCLGLVEILGRLESLVECNIYDCEFLTRIPDIPNFKTLHEFRIENCNQLCRESQGNR